MINTLFAKMSQAPGNDPAQALLEQMHDIQPPPPAAAWPPAPIWWLLLLIVFAILAAVLIALYKRRQKRAYRKIALHRLDQLQRDLQHNRHSHQQHLAELGHLLKQVFLTAYPGARRFAGRVTGIDLDLALTATLPERQRMVPDKRWFIAAYDPDCNIDPAEMEQFASLWIRHHQPLTTHQLQRRLADNWRAREAGHV